MQTATEQTTADLPAGALADRPPIPYGRWDIDSDRSSIAFVAHSFGLLRVDGTLGAVNGSVASVPDAPPSAAGAIALDGLCTGNARRDEHLLSDDFLAAGEHPWIGFAAERIEVGGRRLHAVAGITVRGRTSGVEIAGTLDAGAAGELLLDLEATVDRRDFGVETSGPLEWGGFAVGRRIGLRARLVLSRCDAQI